MGKHSSNPSPKPPSSEDPPASDDPFAHLSWVEPAESPFGVRVLDCRSVSRSMVATTSDRNVAMRFVELRSSYGEQHRGLAPVDALRVECDLWYPPRGEIQDGPVFLSQEMEDKWDIYLLDGHLYFARSWTGELVFRAWIELTEAEVRISTVEAKTQAVRDDATFAVRQVDYLVKSHLYDREVPHPIPADFPDDPQQIALFSFSQNGRRAAFASYEDTTLVRLS